MLTVDDIKPGRQLGRYRLVKELGRGAAGFVFAAEDTLVSHRLCVKVLHPRLSHDPEAIGRFHRELVLARRVVHKGVCRVHDLHEADGLKFITMELVEGVPLSAMLALEKSGAPMAPARAIAIAIGICDALAAAHDVGVVHRDLKPKNVMLRDAAPNVVLLDFGIATALDMASGLTMPGRTLGTPHYIAPEVWEGSVATAKADQFAVGVMLFNMLTTKMPWSASQDVLLYEAMKNAAAPPVSMLRRDCAALDPVVRQALAFHAKDRFADVKALARALASLDVRAPQFPGKAPTIPPAVFIDATEKIDLGLERTRPSNEDDLTLPLPSISAVSSTPPLAAAPLPLAPIPSARAPAAPIPRGPSAPLPPAPAPLTRPPAPLAPLTRPPAPLAPPATAPPAAAARPSAAQPTAPGAWPPVAGADFSGDESASWVIAGQAAGPPLKTRPQKAATVFDDVKGTTGPVEAPVKKPRGRMAAGLLLFVVVAGAALAYLGGFIP